MIDQALGLPDLFLQPDYGGGSIANVPATMAALLDVPFVGLPPLYESLWQPLQGGVKRVVLLVLDALGQNLIDRERGMVAGLREQTAVSAQLTSVFPSTTVAALSSFWTGGAPAQHGMVGLNLLLPEYDTVSFMLQFRASYDRTPDSLVDAGLKPEEFLAIPGFAEQLAAGGVETHAFKGHEIIKSVLSKAHGRGVTDNHAAYSVADMFVQMRQLLEARPGQRLFLSAYWPTIDSMSHRRGWDSEAVATELQTILYQLQTQFLDRLSPAARRDTVFFLVADHGQTATPVSDHIYLDDHPELEQMLLMFAPGEPRTRYLYVRQGEQTAVTDYINHYFGHAAVVLPAKAALNAGLLGPQPHATAVSRRIGDLIVTMRDSYLFTRRNEKIWLDTFCATHGGMTPAEMQVPWFGLRL
ncbi:MAG: alkaline phosphatase family protein [Chloroflexota bacterium]